MSITANKLVSETIVAEQNSVRTHLPTSVLVACTVLLHQAQANHTLI